MGFPREEAQHRNDGGIVIFDGACHGREAGRTRLPVLPAGARVRLCCRVAGPWLGRRHLPHSARPDADRADAGCRLQGDAGERRSGRLSGAGHRLGCRQPGRRALARSGRRQSAHPHRRPVLSGRRSAGGAAGGDRLDHAGSRPRQLVLDAHALHRRQFAVAGPGLRRAAGRSAARRHPWRQARTRAGEFAAQGRSGAFRGLPQLGRLRP